ncbi:hypothetical protein AVEN_124869-1 [Araneus ventricosus]|uniref:Uncharacterized protein n=1 Tax=Araneus ventricosus TaxID=182803 RepID=A0A4Y2S4D7_ARAVE|nr:hypothetical protein AVEN_124869-1 [Araneus ventricosus]
MNLCLHEKDFKLKAQRSFFATSHGKTECDGIGGTVKRLARKQSLQQHLDRQITTTNELFEFCKVNIANITFQHISKEAVDSTSLILVSRLKDTQTLPGTRLFHNFQPIDDLGMIEARRISRDETPALTFNLLKHQTLLVKMKDLYPGCFVGCIYENSISIIFLAQQGRCMCSTHPSHHRNHETSKNNDWKNLSILSRMHVACKVKF